MSLKVYRQKVSKQATTFIQMNGKNVAVNFTGGLVIEGRSTGCYITSNKEIQDILEARPDFSDDKCSNQGNFYIETIVAQPEDIKEPVKKIGMIEESKADIDANIKKEIDEQLNDMVKETLKIPVEETTEDIPAQAEEESIEVTSTDEVVEKTPNPELLEVNGFMKAKAYLLKYSGATPEDIKNKPSMLSFMSANNITFPNFNFK